MNMTGATYLGDGLYMNWEGDILVLAAYNGIEVTNVVYLEPEVLASLLQNLKKKNAPEYPFDGT